MLRSWRGWVFVFVALLFSIWIVVGSKSFQSCMQEEHHKSAQENAIKSPAQFFAAISACKDCSGHFVEENGEAIIASFTIILALSTIGLWLATNQLWQAGERQMELIERNAVKQSAEMLESLSASRSLAIAAAKSADAALTANDIAKVSAERQLRAYLALFKARIENVATGEKPNVSFKVRNMGQTPAFKLSGHVGIGFGPFPIPRGAKVILPASPDEISRVDLAPKMRVAHSATMGVPLTEIQFNQLNERKAAIYIVANIEFTDAFNRKWIQRLRLMYNWRGLHSGSNKVEVCAEGNEIEEITTPA
jgi:hypothetical protein